MNPETSRKIKRIVAREGLIIIAIATLMYITKLFGPEYHWNVPEYKVELVNGEVYNLPIIPDYDKSVSDKEFIRKSKSPSVDLLSKRIEEFIVANKINSKALRASPIQKTRKDIFYDNLFYFIWLENKFYQIGFLYFFISLIRFIIWAVKMVRGKP